MNNFLIYRSSAGSGKTYTLVKNTLSSLSDPEGLNIHLHDFLNRQPKMKPVLALSSILIENNGLNKLLLMKG
jgi:hypothetical protein